MAYHNKTNQKVLLAISQPKHQAMICSILKRSKHFISPVLNLLIEVGLAKSFVDHKDRRIKYFYAVPVEVPPKKVMLAMNHKIRSKILEVMNGQSTPEIAQEIGVGIVSAKRHLRILREAGIAKSVKKGTTLYWTKNNT